MYKIRTYSILVNEYVLHIRLIS